MPSFNVCRDEIKIDAEIDIASVGEHVYIAHTEIA